MRDDMAKVVTERPRANGHDQSCKGEKRREAKIGLEDMPKREPLRHARNKTKEFTDVLGPLRRYVISQVGRPFHKVFSEIADKLKVKSLQGSHILEHLWAMLITKVIIVKGKPCHSDRPTPAYREDPLKLGYDQIEDTGGHGAVAYVDPRTGIIRRAPQGESPYKKCVRRTASKKLPIVWIDETHYYRKIFDSIWFEVTLAPLPYTDGRVLTLCDVVLDVEGKQGKPKAGDIMVNMGVQTRRFHEFTEGHDGKAVYAIDKRQLSSQEIRKLKLNEKVK